MLSKSVPLKSQSVLIALLIVRFSSITKESSRVLINLFNSVRDLKSFNFFKDDFEIEIKKSQGVSYNLIARNLVQKDLFYEIIIDSNLLSIKKIEIKNRENITLSSFLTLSYKFNLSLPSSLFKFDKSKFKDYILIEN